MKLKFCGLVLVLILSGCSSGSPDSSVARSMVEQYYQAVLNQDRDRAAGFFTSKRSLEERISHYNRVLDTFGRLTSYQINMGEVNTVLRGRFYIFEVQVQYDRGGLVQETVTAFNEVGSKETSIVGHALNAKNISLSF